MRQHKAAIMACILTLLLSPAVACAIETGGRIAIPLKINKEFEQQMLAAWIDFGDGATTTGTEKNTRLGQAPGKTLVAVEPVEDQPNTYLIKVDANGDGRLNNDLAQIIRADDTVRVAVNRKWGNKEEPLPYLVTLARDTASDGKVKEIFYWRPGYCAEGRLKTDGCESALFVLDINGDGLFDQKDFARGTTIGLDRNGDGRVWGRGEWLMGKQVIEYCGKAFLIEGVEPDGASITLVETSLRVPKVGEAIPSFSLRAVNGKTILSEELRGKIYLLDFWASWCKPCVAKFPDVKGLKKEFGAELEIITINVDEKNRWEQARQIVKQYKLSWIQVMSGQGQDDAIWKMIGGMADNQLTIPLYLVVAPDGKISYAGHGGGHLSELRAKMKELLAEKKHR